MASPHVTFIIKPKEDACPRCKEIAYINGEDDTEGYRIHTAYIADFKQTSPVHPNCRCEVVVINEDEDIYEKEFLEEVSVDLINKSELKPDSAVSRTPPFNKTKWFYRPTKNILFHYYGTTKRQTGTGFFTVVAESVTNFFNWLLKKLLK